MVRCQKSGLDDKSRLPPFRILYKTRYRRSESRKHYPFRVSPTRQSNHSCNDHRAFGVKSSKTRQSGQSTEKAPTVNCMGSLPDGTAAEDPCGTSCDARERP
jgi:hypothetical protein